jgi:hypothetical protein
VEQIIPSRNCTWRVARVQEKDTNVQVYNVEDSIPLFIVTGDFNVMFMSLNLIVIS